MYPTFFLKDLTPENKEVSLAALYCLVFYTRPGSETSVVSYNNFHFCWPVF